MPEGTSQVWMVLLFGAGIWVYSFFMERRRKRLNDEFEQLERRKVDALERIATALEKRQ